MSEIIYGRNSLNEAIRGNRILKAYILKDSYLLPQLQQKRIPYEIKDRSFLDKLTKSANHQGVVAEVKEYKLYSVQEMLKKEKGLIVILDSLKDPHNLGAIIRTCDCVGVDGLIYKKHNSVHLNETVAKVASGALEYVKVAEVTNLVNAIKELKENGYWIIGTDASAKTFYNQQDYNMNVALVIGSEGEGISRLVSRECDFMIKLPMAGHVTSLNASVAAGIMLYNILDKRS